MGLGGQGGLGLDGLLGSGGIHQDQKLKNRSKVWRGEDGSSVAEAQLQRLEVPVVPGGTVEQVAG